jgi:hypothetical protein
MDDNMSLDLKSVNCVVYLYLSGSYSLELPPANFGQWLIIQNATPSTAGYSLSITGTNLWTGIAASVAANNYVSFRAMDKDGTILWRDLNGTGGMVPA